MRKTVYSVGSGIALSHGLLIGAATAQVIIDNTTPTAIDTSVTGCSGNCITGGLRDGGGTGPNVFHSFSDFNIGSGDTITFDNAAGITNIFSRITGPNTSTIDGTLGVNGSANLFLLNPNGIVFGESAALSIPGSFLTSTADSILFQDENQFSSTPSALPSLLTVNVPIGLQFGASPGPIEIQGNGHNLAYNRGSFTISRSTPTSQLTASNGQTLAFLGGDVSIPGGNITAQEGHIEIASLGSHATVGLSLQTSPLSPQVSEWNFDYTTTNLFKDIDLSQQASLDVSGSDAGSLQLQGRNIRLADGAIALAQVLSNGGGNISLNASESIELSGVNFSPTTPTPTGVYIEIAPGAAGDGSSQLQVNTNQLTLTAGGQIGLGMGGSGSSGSVDVNAHTITADGGSDINPSSLFAGVLRVWDIPLGSSSSGPSPTTAATGQGGDLNITTDQIRLSNGAQLIASTFSTGDAGNLTIKEASSIQVEGFNAGGASSIIATSEIPANRVPFLPDGSGNGGNLTIFTDNLAVRDGGQIAVSTISPNPAGNLTVEASNTIELQGNTARGRSGLFANSIFGPGAGGNIKINTDQLSLLEGATINVSNFPSSTSGPPPGTGAAGNIDISATTALSLSDQSIITADTVSGDRANITLQSDSVVLRRGSNITTSATGSATGGNININTDALIAFENSDISANSVNSFGGRVVVDAATILGTAYREQPTADSDITASSSLGPAFSGSVAINQIEEDPTNDLTKLPAGLSSEEQIVAACEQTQSNTFVATGRGGLPEDASQLMTGQSIWNDFRFLDNVDSNSYSKSEAEPHLSDEQETVTTQSGPIVEAQTWSVNSEGQIVFGLHSDVLSTSLHTSAANCLS
ncbi:MAG: filamentous hemagglutinin N-terminal domain-containing protein [Cyanobacteria bacterium J06581_3]